MRQRIRTEKPEAGTDEDLWDLGQETGLPVFQAYVMLWTCCDREGRFEWRPRPLKAACLPYWDGDFSRVLDALLTRGLLVKYACQGKEFGVVRSFKRHQLLNGKEPPSELPAPPEPLDHADDSSNITTTSRVDDASSTRDERVTDATATRYSHSHSHHCSHSQSSSQDGRGAGGTDDGQTPPREPLPPDGPASNAGKVPCPPAPEVLTPEQRATLETSGIPGWAIEAIAADFAARYAADPDDRRTLVAWRKCASRAVSGDWNNPNRRPRKPEPGGTPPPRRGPLTDAERRPWAHTADAEHLAECASRRMPWEDDDQPQEAAQ